ncbi:MAG: cellobiose phosphorylase [Firmicutes bacterium]|nr:cellobiose phosphorylase [Bacillota bacterium]
MNNYQLLGDVYKIEGYDELPAFSSFLPGLAGKKGIPLWVYYTNRGQGVNSFGIHHKNNAIMEFNPANTAYENVSVKGFRTFIRCNGQFFEPFREYNPQAKRNFFIRKNSFWIEETNHEFGLKITVKYFVLPNNSIGALVRTVEIENLDKTEKKLEILDGQPKIIPYGITNSQYKEMSNLFKSWTEIKNIEEKAPFYTMRSSSDDSAEVSEVEGGYYYVGIHDGKIMPVLYDAEVIFDFDTSLVQPIAFLKNSLTELLTHNQCFYNKVPCGFTPLSLKLNAEEKDCFYSLTGFAGTCEQLNAKLPEFCAEDFILRNETMADELVDQLTADIRTHSGMPVFDQYMEQNYLDNFLRGGYPIVFGKEQNKSVVHLFSRKHGDPERDYNFFSIAGEYYSQGNGNFRDVNQNRRNDVFFHNEIDDFNIKTFFELIQIDGYNPLEVRPSTFSVKPECSREVEQLLKAAGKDQTERLVKIISRPFTPGQISNCIAKYHIELTVDEDDLLEELLSSCNQNIEAGFGEGYWSDHWDYNMDLVDSYLRMFPDRKQQLLFGDQSYRFYDSAARVLPRSEKYVITKKNEARQYGALVHDEEKAAQPGFDKKGTNWLKTKSGNFTATTLMGKMISLALNKFSSLDPYGMGVEMEGGKPGWNDAMNGLPGLFGSGMSETFELKRLISFLCDSVTMVEEIHLPVEICSFLFNVAGMLSLASKENWNDFTYWDRVSTLREQFREEVRFTTTGSVQKVSTKELLAIFSSFLVKLDLGIDKACVHGKGLVPTYFTFHATEFEPVLDEEGHKIISGYGLPKAVVKAFEVQPLPAFLEGPAKMLPTLRRFSAAKELYQKVRESELYDRKLGMYKTSVPIEHISMENGRIRAFTAGWLERESVFLHMEYKYLLSILRAGLYEQFYEEIKTAMVVFRDPAEYGRSILENSSFLASSMNPNESIHGRGYVARLTGSTTEVITMWIEMFMGDTLFTAKEGELKLHFNPKLAEWMFDENGRVSFTLFSKCKVTYVNPSCKATYGDNAAIIDRIEVMDTKEVLTGNTISGSLAERIRSGEIGEIIVYFK